MYAGAFAQAGIDVAFAAEGERARRLRTAGITVNGQLLHMPVIDVASAGDHNGDAPRLIIVAVKHHHLPEVCRWLGGLVGSGTSVLSVMNGIESEQTIAEAVGNELVLPAIAVGMDAVREDGRVTYSRTGRIVFGNWHNEPGNPGERVRAVQELFDAAGIAWETPADVSRALWNKFMLNVGINQVSALLGAPYGVFQQNADARDLMRRAMAEVLPLARAEGVDLVQADLEAWFDVVGSLSPDGKTSMLQDVEAKRKTEVEMFAGRVCALGERHGVNVPVNAFLLHAIRVLETL